MGILRVAGCSAVLVWAASLAIFDVRQRRLPNLLTLTGAIVILAAATAAGRGVPAVLGGLALGGLYLVVHLADPHGLGGGDVKLALGLGALTGALGVEVWVLAALGAPMLTAGAGVVSLLRGRGGAVPHGPAMLAATLTVVGLAVL